MPKKNEIKFTFIKAKDELLVCQGMTGFTCSKIPSYCGAVYISGWHIHPVADHVRITEECLKEYIAYNKANKYPNGDANNFRTNFTKAFCMLSQKQVPIQEMLIAKFKAKLISEHKNKRTASSIKMYELTLQ